MTLCFIHLWISMKYIIILSRYRSTLVKFIFQLHMIRAYCHPLPSVFGTTEFLHSLNKRIGIYLEMPRCLSVPLMMMLDIRDDRIMEFPHSSNAAQDYQLTFSLNCLYLRKVVENAFVHQFCFTFHH